MSRSSTRRNPTAAVLGAVLSAACCVALPAGAQTGQQIVTATPAGIAVDPRASAGFDVVYDTSPADPTLPGLGFSVHWDSRNLQDPVISGLFATALVGQEVLDDASDLDGDPSTNRRLLVAWLDANGGWPGALPQKLFTAAFSPAAGFTPGSTTTIRFAKVSTAAQWTFVAGPVTVTAVFGPRFFTLAPCRVIDTRNAIGPLGGPALAAGATRVFPVSGACGIPPEAKSVSVNLTVTDPTAAGYLTLFPGDEASPLASSINFRAGQTRANNAIQRLPSAGASTIAVLDGSEGSVHLVLDVNGYFALTPTGDEITVNLPGLPAGAKPLVLVRIPAGTFQMGSPTTEYDRELDEVLHDVTLAQDYYMGKYEVTQAQWQAVTGTPMPAGCGSYGVGNDYPVYCVSWSDIAGTGGFVEKLRTITGDTRFRLPTEAEWERAARGGGTTQTRFSFGDALDSDDGCGASAAADPYVWWCGNSGGASHVVGTKGANQYGLFDMHGSQWEWVQDWYGAYTIPAPPDPTGPVSGSDRAGRGGGWGADLRSSRSAERAHGPDARYNNTGFRVTRSLYY